MRHGIKSISDILVMNFNIPKYQRGYRWTKQQVIDLLNDIKEFTDRKSGEHEIYCIQPLVVNVTLKTRARESLFRIKN